MWPSSCSSTVVGLKPGLRLARMPAAVMPPAVHAAALAPAVRVNGVALGAILPPPGRDESYIREYANRRVPLGHPGGSPAVVDAVLYLLEQEFVTGAVLPLDGGEFLEG